MPVNRNALIRYKTIDKCLQNRYREWTLEDLIEACSEALYEYEGIVKGISKRTIQLDIQMMRSDKLGYNAPIIVYDNKYYTYEDKGYSITNIPLTDQDLNKMSEAVEFMKQFKGFSHFRELDGMIQKLEDHVYSQKKKQKPVIDFEKNENLKGLEHLDVLYQAIIQQRAIRLTYQSFKARQPNNFDFHPYLLKEFRNRWYLLGARKKDEPVLTLALDRILEISPADTYFFARDDFDPEKHFKNVIGVTVEENQEPVKIVLYVSHKHANYVITKPLHSSQKVIERDSHGITIELQVQHNFELEKEILGLGEGLMVVAPERLKRHITSRLNEAIDLYNTALNEKGMALILKKLENKGYAVANNLFTKKSLRQMGSVLFKAGVIDGQEKVEKRIDLTADLTLSSLILNRNIEKIMNLVAENVQTKEVMFHRGIADELFEWRQCGDDSGLSLVFFLEHARISSFPLQLIPGSHRKHLSPEEQALIIDNTVPTEITLSAGGAIFINSLLIRRFPEELRNRMVKFFEVRFGRN